MYVALRPHHPFYFIFFSCENKLSKMKLWAKPIFCKSLLQEHIPLLSQFTLEVQSLYTCARHDLDTCAMIFFLGAWVLWVRGEMYGALRPHHPFYFFFSKIKLWAKPIFCKSLLQEHIPLLSQFTLEVQSLYTCARHDLDTCARY